MGETLPLPNGDPTNPEVLNVTPALNITPGGLVIDSSRLRNYPRALDPALPIDSPDQTFDDCRTIEGWTSMIHKLLHAAWDKKGNLTGFQFSHDFNLLGDDPANLKGAIIVYEIISEEPADYKGKIERKPRLRQIISTNNGEKQWIYAQSFDVIVAFNIYGDSWGRAIDTTEHFKELMLTYFGIFKQFGLQEIYYRGQMRDALYDPPGVQEFPNRTVFFCARIERQINVNYAEIEQILITAGILSEVTGVAGDQTVSATVTGIDSSPVLPGPALSG